MCGGVLLVVLFAFVRSLLIDDAPPSITTSARAAPSITSARAAAAAARGGADLALLVVPSGDAEMLAAAANAALSLRAVRREHYLILTAPQGEGHGSGGGSGEAEATCGALAAAQLPLACGTTALLRGGGGGSEASSPALRAAAARWHFASRLSALGYRVLLLDPRVALLADPYPLVEGTPALQSADILAAESADTASPFAAEAVLLRAAAVGGPAHWVAAEAAARLEALAATGAAAVSSGAPAASTAAAAAALERAVLNDVLEELCAGPAGPRDSSPGALLAALAQAGLGGGGLLHAQQQQREQREAGPGAVVRAREASALEALGAGAGGAQGGTRPHPQTLLRASLRDTGAFDFPGEVLLEVGERGDGANRELWGGARTALACQPSARPARAEGDALPQGWAEAAREEAELGPRAPAAAAPAAAAAAAAANPAAPAGAAPAAGGPLVVAPGWLFASWDGGASAERGARGWWNQRAPPAVAVALFAEAPRPREAAQALGLWHARATAALPAPARPRGLLALRAPVAAGSVGAYQELLRRLLLLAAASGRAAVAPAVDCERSQPWVARGEGDGWWRGLQPRAEAATGLPTAAVGACPGAPFAPPASGGPCCHFRPPMGEAGACWDAAAHPADFIDAATAEARRVAPPTPFH